MDILFAPRSFTLGFTLGCLPMAAAAPVTAILSHPTGTIVTDLDSGMGCRELTLGCAIPAKASVNLVAACGQAIAARLADAGFVQMNADEVATQEAQATFLGIPMRHALFFRTAGPSHLERAMRDIALVSRRDVPPRVVEIRDVFLIVILDISACDRLLDRIPVQIMARLDAEGHAAITPFWPKSMNSTALLNRCAEHLLE